MRFVRIAAHIWIREKNATVKTKTKKRKEMERMDEKGLQSMSTSELISPETIYKIQCTDPPELRELLKTVLLARLEELKASKELRTQAIRMFRTFELAEKEDAQREARLRNLEVPENPSFFTSDGTFLHNVMGNYLTKKHNICKINGAIHIYDNGVYRPGEDAIHGLVIDELPRLTDARRREVYKYIRVSPGTPEREVSPPHLIPFATKIYDIEAEKFLDYSPEHVFLNRFPYDYKPDAPECETITKTIRDIAAEDEAVINLLYEAMGNCFYMVNSFRGAVMLYGRSGNNGKSTLLNMITQLIGKQNASFLSLQDTAERFRLADVYGKAANIGDDISNAFLQDSSIFKKLVTGEEVTAERKGRDPFFFRPYAKFFFALNGLPPVGDKSKAFFGRVLLVPLNKDFSKAGNVSLKNRAWTTEEMECLTRHAMEGLKRLRAAGRFTMPECVKEALEEYERENNPVKEFLDSFGDVIGRTTADVYTAFTSWCFSNGHKNVPTQRRFTSEVCAQADLKVGTIRIAGGTARGYKAKDILM